MEDNIEGFPVGWKEMLRVRTTLERKILGYYRRNVIIVVIYFFEVARKLYSKV